MLDTVPASAAEKTAVVKDDDSSSSSGVVAISVLDSPAVSQIDLDISNMGANKKQKEGKHLGCIKSFHDVGIFLQYPIVVVEIKLFSRNLEL